jgi:acyl carrier protein
MTREEILQQVLNALSEIAPEADPQKLRPAVSLRDQLDIDSMDFLNFMIALSKNLLVDIPERDYPKLASLDSCTEYLQTKVHSRLDKATTT